MTPLAVVHRKTWLTALSVAAVGAAMLVHSPAAHADPTSFDPKTSVVVTRLPLVGQAGRIPVQLTIGYDNTIGFDISVPAGAGSWTTSRDLAVPALGVHCHGLAGPALHYACGQTQPDYEAGNHLLPKGTYQLSLPAQRTGSYAGLVGTASLVKLDAYGESFQYVSDTFPVVDGTSGPRSNAEVRNLTTSSPDQSPGGVAVGDLAVTVTVVGGETRTTGLDVQLPGPDQTWSLLRISGGGHLTCASTSATTVHCGTGAPWPTGVFTAVLHLSATESESAGPSAATVALDYADGTRQIPDTFGWFFDYIY